MIELERRLYIRNLTAKILLDQDDLTSVIDVRDMKLPKNIYISSFRDYSNITGIPVDELSNNGLLDDGYTVKVNDINIILYNSDYDYICPQRLRFSLAHEIGHIFLHHIEDDYQSEEEANYFAAQIVAHDAIAVTMLHGSWDSDLNFIREQFGIAWTTAEIKLREINRNKRAYNSTEIRLFNKYKYNFNKQVYSRNKFANVEDMAYIEYDEAFA